VLSASTTLSSLLLTSSYLQTQTSRAKSFAKGQPYAKG